MERKKALIAGASGLVGYAAVRHFAGMEDWDVVGVSRRVPEGLLGATLLSVDLQDKARCAEVFGDMKDVTHLVYTALFEKPGVVKGWREQVAAPKNGPSWLGDKVWKSNVKKLGVERI